jgi:hypothetical protein
LIEEALCGGMDGAILVGRLRQRDLPGDRGEVGPTQFELDGAAL